jgi:hypothetical protein
MRTTRRGAHRGVLIVVAGALLVLAACDGGDEAPAADPSPAATAVRVEANAVEIATGFVEAFGAFDPERAVAYLAEDAEVPQGLFAEQLPVLISFYEAQGYEQTLDPCEVTSGFAHGTVIVRCPYDFHAIRSEEIGLGPYHGSYWDLTIGDGEIVRAMQVWEIEKFSPQMWEPFQDWVSATNPKDFDAMYNGGGTDFRVSEESIRLWEQHTREYVKEVGR